MSQFTSTVPNSVDHVEPLEISWRYSMVPVLGLLAAIAGVVSVCALPYGLLSISHGSWDSGAKQFDFQPVLLGIFVTLALAVSVLGICAGVASGAGMPWSRAGMMLYAELTMLLSVIGFIPFYLCVLRTPVMDIGLRHAVEFIVMLKLWLVELPLSIAIAYWFSRPDLIAACEHPEMKAPDLSQR
jgi:hypothetical protein